MTLGKCIDIAEKIAPSDYERSLKLRWISELEGRIALELYNRPIEELEEYAEDSSDTLSLGVPFPFDQIYWMYLVAMVDFANGDSVRYSNSAGAFNTSFEKFAKWVLRNKNIGEI